MSNLHMREDTTLPKSASGNLSRQSSDAAAPSPMKSPDAASAAAAATAKPKGFREVFVRTIFTWLMAYTFLAIVGKGITWLLPFIISIKIMMFYEVLRINQKERKYRQMPYFKLLPWYFLVVTVAAFTFYNVQRPLEQTFPWTATWYHNFGIITFGLYVAGFVAFVLSLKKGMYRYQIGQFTWIAMALLFIIVQGSLQVKNMLRGTIWFVFPVSCVVNNDIWAYITGKCFGRTKLLLLSPKKTLEGFIGAWIFTSVWAFWFSGFLSNFDYMTCPPTSFTGDLHCARDSLFIHRLYELPWWIRLATFGFYKVIYIAPIQFHAIAFAAFASLVAPFGGFFASALKRAFKLKDFGDLIPGHGGMTDRMDCQIINGAFTYFYISTFLFPHAKCPGNTIELLKCAQTLPREAQETLAREILQGLGQ